jgi:hypothetical protein
MSPRSARFVRGRRVVHVRCSTRLDGDFHLDIDRSTLEHRRQAFEPGPWTQLDEVHGARVLQVHRPGEFDMAEGDAAVTACEGAVLAVWVGDCAPVVLLGDNGAVGVAHAGWRGALDGVLQAAVGAMRDIGSAGVDAVLGPCIHPCCYEFGQTDLQTVVDRHGLSVAAFTTWGTPSLSMPAVVESALAEVGVGVSLMSSCTRCSPDTYFSHRRGDKGRQVMTVTAMADG